MTDRHVHHDGGSKGPALGEDLFPELYEELRGLAARYLTSEPAGHTLQATALVHEAWLRLGGDSHRPLERGKFFCAPPRRPCAAFSSTTPATRPGSSGGGEFQRVSLDVSHLPDETQPQVNLIALDAALERLASQDERKARIIELRYFAGLDHLTTAETPRDFRLDSPARRGRPPRPGCGTSWSRTPPTAASQLPSRGSREAAAGAVQRTTCAEAVLDGPQRGRLRGASTQLVHCTAPAAVSRDPRDGSGQGKRRFFDFPAPATRLARRSCPVPRGRHSRNAPRSAREVSLYLSSRPADGESATFHPTRKS